VIARLPGPKHQHLALPSIWPTPRLARTDSVLIVHLGGLDIVVNAAAMLHRQLLAEVSPESLHLMTAVNRWGPFFSEGRRRNTWRRRVAAHHFIFEPGGYTAGTWVQQRTP